MIAMLSSANARALSVSDWPSAAATWRTAGFHVCTPSTTA